MCTAGAVALHASIDTLAGIGWNAVTSHERAGSRTRCDTGWPRSPVFASSGPAGRAPIRPHALPARDISHRRIPRMVFAAAHRKQVSSL
jgi:hypothetical protein